MCMHAYLCQGLQSEALHYSSAAAVHVVAKCQDDFKHLPQTGALEELKRGIQHSLRLLQEGQERGEEDEGYREKTE